MNDLKLVKDQINALITQNEEKDKDDLEHSYGLVIYTDGGCDKGETGNQGPGGAGMHGYLYDAAIKKTISYSPDGQTLTDGGYYDTSIIARKLADDDEKTGHLTNVIFLDKQSSKGAKKQWALSRVQPIGYFDGLQYSPKPTTNNITELLGLLMALRFINEVGGLVKRVHLRLDSKYALDGVLRFIEHWKSNDWRGATSDVKNVGIWQEIWEERQKLLERINANEIAVSFEHVYGHTDYYGNICADTLTWKARIASSKSDASFFIQPAATYFKASHNPNKLLAMPRWYYCTGDNRDFGGKQIHYMGRHGKEELDVAFGSRMTDLCYAVVLTDVDPVLNVLRQRFEEEAKSYKEELIYFTNVDQIFSRKTYDELCESGLLYTTRDDKKISLYDKSVLVVNASPVNTAFVAFEQFSVLERKLLEARGDKLLGNHILTDITDFIYGSKENKKGEKSTITLPESDAVLEVKVKHKNSANDEMEEHAIVLTRGLDIPKRSVFLGIQDDEPKVQVLTWHESKNSFRFATIVSTNKGDWAIYTGAYTNQRIVAGAKKK